MLYGQQCKHCGTTVALETENAEHRFFIRQRGTADVAKGFFPLAIGIAKEKIGLLLAALDGHELVCGAHALENFVVKTAEVVAEVAPVVAAVVPAAAPAAVVATEVAAVAAALDKALETVAPTDAPLQTPYEVKEGDGIQVEGVAGDLPAGTIIDEVAAESIAPANSQFVEADVLPDADVAVIAPAKKNSKKNS